MESKKMDLLLASPRGFCAGVDRAITIVEKALDLYGAPIYVRHEIVHNPHVVDRLRERGAIFVDELSEVPKDSNVIFSAHGVSPVVREEAEKLGFNVLDATCPLVTKVHSEATKYASSNHTIILIGHPEHVEVEGTVGEAPDNIIVISTEEEISDLKIPDESKIAFLTQTTLSLDDTAGIITALRKRFPKIQGPKKDDICYATQNRQNAVKELIKQVDLVLVVGSKTSSNTLRLVEVARTAGVESHRIQSKEELDPSWFEGNKTVGITAGASAPEYVVQGIVTALQAMADSSVTEIKIVEEDVTFALPSVLRKALEEKGMD